MALHTCRLLSCSFAWYKAHLENLFGFLIKEGDQAPRIFAFLLAVFMVWQVQEQQAAPKIFKKWWNCSLVGFFSTFKISSADVNITGEYDVWTWWEGSIIGVEAAGSVLFTKNCWITLFVFSFALLAYISGGGGGGEFHCRRLISN